MPGRPDRVQAGHHAGAAEGDHEVVPAAHLAEAAGDDQREHGLFAGAVRVGVDDPQHHPRGP